MAWLNRIIEGLMPLSFSSPGFRSREQRFDPSDLDVDMTGKVCLVTGGNAGLGRAMAKALATRGATVHLLCRNAERGNTAARELSEETDNPQVHAEVLDIADQQAVRRFAEDFAADHVDVLIHNAGVLLDQRQESPDAIEQTWATAVSGPFLLTWLLLPQLDRARQGRVIFVSSGGMYSKRLRLDDWQWRERTFDGVAAYAWAKRAQVVLTELWAERLGDCTTTVNAMHPGWADTGGVKRSLPRFYELTRSFLRSPEQGADTAVWLAVCERLRDASGGFYFDREAVKTHKLPWTRETREEREALWQHCLDVTGLVGPRRPR